MTMDITTSSATVEKKTSTPDIHLSVPAPPIPPRTLGRVSRSAGSFLSGGSFLSADFRSELEEAGECAFVAVEQGDVNVISMPPPPPSRPQIEEVVVPAAAVAAEIFVNGEGYSLGSDGMFRPSRSLDTPFNGYAVFSHGVFKPLGGSPAAIDSRTLYRVIAVTGVRGHGGLPLHRIKGVLQLLTRGTSGHSEHLFVYDDRWQGFVQSNRTRRFPAEDKMARPGEFGEISHVWGGGSAEDLVWEGHQRGGKRAGMVLRSYSAPLRRAPTPPLAEIKTAQDGLSSSQFGGRRLMEEPRLRFEENLPRAQRALSDDGQRSWLDLDIPTTRSGGGGRPGNETTPPFPPLSSRFKEGQANYRSPPPTALLSSATVPTTTIPKKTAEEEVEMGDRSSRVDTFSAATPFHHILDPPQFILTITLKSSHSQSFSRTSRVDVPGSDLTDRDFFTLLRREHNSLCGSWRAALSLRGVRSIKPKQNYRKHDSHYSPPIPISDTFFSQRSLLQYFHRPSSAGAGAQWVAWATAVACDGEVALDFTHGWLPSRILVAGAAPLLVSVAATVAWCLVGPERAFSTAFLFGWLVLAVGGGCVAVVAVVSAVV